MEPKFQTSFIPKRPLPGPSGAGLGGVPRPVARHNTSIFMSLAVLIFIISVLGIGGAYGWKYLLISTQDSYKRELAQRQQQFNLDLIEQLKQANTKIDLADRLLSGHVAASQIFDIIGRLTIESVRFLNLDLSTPTAGSDGVKISLTGYGTNFQAVAFQSDVLSSLEKYGLRRVVRNPILSDPSLSENGTVSFGFSATIDSGSVSYEKAVNGDSSSDSNAGSAPDNSSVPPPAGQTPNP